MSRLALLLPLLFCGCLTRNVPAPPKPDATSLIDEVGDRYAATFRQTCLDAAANLRSGKWTTDLQYRDGHKALVKDAVEAAGTPFATRQQAEATPFTPEGMADWLEQVAREGQPE